MVLWVKMEKEDEKRKKKGGGNRYKKGGKNKRKTIKDGKEGKKWEIYKKREMQ